MQKCKNRDNAEWYDTLSWRDRVALSVKAFTQMHALFPFEKTLSLKGHKFIDFCCLPGTETTVCGWHGDTAGSVVRAQLQVRSSALVTVRVFFHVFAYLCVFSLHILQFSPKSYKQARWIGYYYV